MIINILYHFMKEDVLDVMLNIMKIINTKSMPICIGKNKLNNQYQYHETYDGFNKDDTLIYLNFNINELTYYKMSTFNNEKKFIHYQLIQIKHIIFLL